MKNIQEYLKAGTPESMMRLSMNRVVKTAVFVAIFTPIGAVTGFIIGIILDRNLIAIASGIGALAGLAGAIIGALLIPGFGGKAVQSFSESQNKTGEDK